MKIKHRLFISNILMLVIPIIASAFVSYMILFIFSKSSDNSMERSFPHAYKIMSEFERRGDVDNLLVSVDDFNNEFGGRNIWLAVVRNGRFLRPANARAVLGRCKELLPALLTDGVSGTMNANGVKVTAQQIGDYRILLADLRTVPNAPQFFGRPSPDNILITFGIVIAMILLTNRILTRSVTKSILIPLDLLVNGVHELGGGNLDYRISYKHKDEFAPVCDDFNEMAEHLQSLIERQQKDDISRKELLAGISHDLRTPLTSIKAYVEGLLDGVAEDIPTQLKYLGVIRQKAMDIDSLVDKLFLFSKLEIDEFPFYHQRLDIGTELSEMAAYAGEEYAKKGLNVELKKNLADVFVYADPVQLRGALINIMENSASYKIKETGTLIIEAAETGDAVEIRLTDDGPGMTEEALDKIFDVFYRGDASRQNPSKGSGLGLAITLRVMERMGGTLRAENVSNGGLRMVLTIPKYSESALK